MAYKNDSIKKSVSIRMTDVLRNKVDEKAKLENRSRNNLIEYALKFYLRVTEKK